MSIHPEAIEATERLYNAWRTGQDVRVTDVINDALDKALKRPKPNLFHVPIADTVADYFNISRPMLFKKHRSKVCKEQHLVMARWFVFLLLKDSGKSSNQIGKMFKLDHGTVLNGLRGIRKLMQAYPDREGAHYIKLKELTQQKP